MERNYKEIAKTNTFVKHAKEVREICLVQNVDVGVAVDMYITNHHLTRSKELMDQSKEFRKYCREDTLKSIVEALGK